MNETIDELQGAFTQFRNFHQGELSEIRGQLDEIQMVLNRPMGLGGGAGGGGGRMSEKEQKAFDGAVRALVQGDKARADQLFTEARAMSVGSDPDGGYVVHTQWTREINQIMGEVSPLFRLARVIDLEPGYDSFSEIVDADEADADWVGEQEERPETDPGQLRMFNVPLNEIYAMPKLTQKLVDLSSINLQKWLTDKIGRAFGVKEGVAFHTGDGVKKPTGLLTYSTASTADTARPFGTVQHVVSGSASEVTSDGLIDLVTALKPQYRAGAVWLMNRNTAGAVQKFKDSEGRYIWSTSIQAGQPSTLLGYPVEIDEDMPDAGADALPVAFGNFKRAYTVIQKPGIRFLPDPYSAKPHLLMYAYRRVGGGMHNSLAFKLLKCATS